MLTGTRLRVRSSKGVCSPSFIDPDNERYQERAALLLSLAHEAVARDQTRGELVARIEEEVVGDGVDHKLSRGLADVLLKRCTFESVAPLPAPELRAQLFQRGPVARTAGPAGRRTAQDVFAELAVEHDVSPEAIERGMFSDLKEEQRIQSCDAPSPEWLLNRYNVALAQGLLLHATEVRVQLPALRPEQARPLFRQIKFRQLMHRIQRNDEGYLLILDGPLSLFRLSTRYGMGLAQFLPALLHIDGPWKLEAEVKWKRRYRSMTLTHEDGLRSHTEPTGAWVSREEEWFEERFAATETDWQLERGGALVNLGGEAVLVPDFTLRHNGRVAMIEIVGMWRKAYLKSRIQLLERHSVDNLVLAVSKNLLADKGGLRGLKGPVIPFAKIVPVRDVLDVVERCAVEEARG